MDNKEMEAGLVEKSSHGNFRTYYRRFWVLFLFGMGGMLQSGISNSWGPIGESAICAFGWDAANVTILPAIGFVAYVFTVFPLMALIEYRGLRVASLVMFALLCGVAFIPILPGGSWNTVLIYAGMLLVGLSGPIVTAGPPALSAIWFPPHQRTGATALAALSNLLGVAGSFIIGPNVVEQLNCTSSSNVSSENPKDIELGQIRWYFLAEAGVAVLTCLAALAYYPAKPPTPPSLSAQEQREPIVSSLVKLLKNGQIWLICLSFAFLNGAFPGWGSAFAILVDPIGVKQEEAGYIGFASLLSSVVAGIVVGKAADYLERRHKLILLVINSGSILLIGWMILMVLKLIPSAHWCVWLSFIGMGWFISSTISLYFELGAEVAFPISEGMVSGLMTMIASLISALCLLLMTIFGDKLGAQIMNWYFLVCAVLSQLCLIFFKPIYKRSTLDDAAKTTHIN